jgi:hypothetical protein
MTRSSIWIVSFVLAMLMSFSIDLSGRDVGLSGISLGGSAAFADRRDRRDRGPKIELPSVLETLADLSDDGDDADDGEAGDDDDGPDDGGDDN